MNEHTQKNTEEEMCPNSSSTAECWAPPALRALERQQQKIESDLNSLHSNTRQIVSRVDTLEYQMESIRALFAQEDQRATDLSSSVEHLESRIDTLESKVDTWFSKIEGSVQAISIAVTTNRIDDVTRWGKFARESIQFIGLIGVTVLMITGGLQAWSSAKAILGIE